MIQVIECKNCGKSNINFDEWSVTVNYNLYRNCGFCRETKTETKSYFFCCEDCFQDYYGIEIK